MYRGLDICVLTKGCGHGGIGGSGKDGVAWICMFE